MTPNEHRHEAELLFRTFTNNGALISAEHSSFLHHCSEAMKGYWSKAEHRDLTAMLETVVLALGIPGAMYGKHPSYNGADLFRNAPRKGSPMRDFDGRWNMHPDMLEKGEPAIIIWQHEEDREWELNQDYVNAFRESMGYGNMVA